jgi:hypothetical protein
MATFSTLLTFFNHILEEFGLSAESTTAVLLHTATNGPKEKVFVDSILLAQETGYTQSHVESRLAHIRSQHLGIYRRNEYYSYSESLNFLL